jgi:hypothetical protein
MFKSSILTFAHRLLSSQVCRVRRGSPLGHPAADEVGGPGTTVKTAPEAPVGRRKHAAGTIPISNGRGAYPGRASLHSKHRFRERRKARSLI